MPTQTTNAVECPKCGASTMWDNRASKRNPKAPDYKCKDRNCDGAVWPEKENGTGSGRQTSQSQTGKQPVNSGDLPGDRVTDVDFPTLCTRYAECVGYIAKTIVPGLTKLDIGTDPQSVAAMSATLFIERNRRNA